jgi:hypothetical protein
MITLSAASAVVAFFVAMSAYTRFASRAATDSVDLGFNERGAIRLPVKSMTRVRAS